ncbi:MAG TPA: FG-GAP-like repeat-containing protein, partial [Niastella sp.]|nr:FG-GAP-like repeat-containing protein [Niastella sp.]
TPLSVTTNRLTAYSSLPFSVSFSAVNKQLTTNSFTNAGSYGTGTYPWSVYSCDLNADGKPELITANAVSDNISVLNNLSAAGNLSFANRVNYTVGHDPKKIAFGDLDGDGKPDLAVVNMNQGLASTISILRNNSTGGNIGFDPKIDIASGDGSIGLGIADINGDGKPDIVVSSGNSYSYSILLNTTVGSAISFAPKQNFTLSKRPSELLLADLDNDGRTDILITNSIDDDMSVYRNTSTGGILSLASRLDFPVGDYPGDVSAGDIDMDGSLDLVIRIDGKYAFLKNYSAPGSISFSSPSGFVLPVRSLNIGDLNGDGKPDLSAGLWLSGKFSIIENTNATVGNVSLGANIDYTTTTYDTYPTIGDLDGDGKPEIAVANVISNSVTVMRNNIDGPTVTQISPAIARKGDVVTITGTNLDNVSAVRFGVRTASSFTIVSPTRIDAVVGGGASGDVSVITSKGTIPISGFQFIPEITANGPLSFCSSSPVTLTSTADGFNQWYVDGILITGVYTPVCVPKISGTYTVKVTSSGIVTTSPAGITVNVTTVPTPTITFTDSVLTSSATTGNRWYLNGAAIPNATAQTYKPAAYGVYTVQVTVNNCTSAFSAGYNHTITGTIDLGRNQYVRLYPNPVRSVMTLQWSINNERTLAVEVRDVYGKTVWFRKNVSSGEPIYLSSLTTGTYFVKMVGSNQQPIGSLKILKVN